MSKRRIVKAVDEYVKSKDETCIVLMLNDDQTKLEGFGDNLWTNVFESQSDIVDQLTDCMKIALTEISNAHLETQRYPKKMPKLFARPGSKDWKGVKIRSQLSYYMSFFDYGPAKKQKYGEGNPPQGWPTVVPWDSFKGPSKGLNLGMCAEIIACWKPRGCILMSINCYNKISDIGF